MSDLVTRSPGWSLPQAAYTDADVFAADLERVFAAHWLFAGHTGELDATGRYLTVDVGRDRVIVVRGEDGVLHAHHDVCAHRGSRVDLGAPGPGQGVRLPVPPVGLRPRRLAARGPADGRLLRHRVPPARPGRGPRGRRAGVRLPRRRGPPGLRRVRRRPRAAARSARARRRAGRRAPALPRGGELEDARGEQPRVLPLRGQPPRVLAVELRRRHERRRAHQPPLRPRARRRPRPLERAGPARRGRQLPRRRLVPRRAPAPARGLRLRDPRRPPARPAHGPRSPTPTSAACAWCRCPTSGPTPTATTR